MGDEVMNNYNDTSNDAMLKIDAVLEEIESYVAGAHRMPLLDRVMVKDDDLFHLMDKLRQELPREVNDAIEVCQRRDEIIQAAQIEAAQILEKATQEAEELKAKANEYAQRTVDENSLILQTNQKAKEIMDQTDEQVKRVREETEAYVAQLRKDAEVYADQMFSHVIQNMGIALEAVQKDVTKAVQAMEDAKKQVHGQQ